MDAQPWQPSETYVDFQPQAALSSAEKYKSITDTEKVGEYS